MEFENTFVVDAPVQEVWDLLLDVERVAPCMPGATVLERTGDDAYKVAVKVKLGPMTMNYKGDVEIVDRDEATRHATMRAKAREARGQGTAVADVRMALEERDGGTSASIITALQMSGKAAAMGQGVIKDVAASLTDTFAKNLAGMVEGGGTAAAAPATEPASADVGEQPVAGASAPAADTPAAGQAPPRAAAPPPGGQAEAPEASLPVGKIIGSVIAGRLRDPKAAGGLVLVAFLLGLLAGRRRS